MEFPLVGTGVPTVISDKMRAVFCAYGYKIGIAAAVVKFT